MKAAIRSVFVCGALVASPFLGGCGGGDSAVDSTEESVDKSSEGGASEITETPVEKVATAPGENEAAQDAKPANDDFSPPKVSEPSSNSRDVVAARPRRDAQEKPGRDRGKEAVFVSADQIHERFGDRSSKRKVVVHTYSDGSKRYDGKFQEWHDNGKLWKEGKYKDNKRTGEWKWWNRKGVLMRKSNFVDDIIDGESVFYFDDGSINRREEWKMGKRHGVVESYYSEGNAMKMQVSWDNGDRHGISQQWYGDGQLMAKYEFLRNERHGTVEEWHENGQKKVKASYRNGKRHGTTVEWADDGEQIVNQEYEDGERVDE